MMFQKSGFMLLMGVLVMVGCGGKQEAAPAAEEAAAPEPTELTAPVPLDGYPMVAALQAKEGFTVSGTVRFEPASDGVVTVTAEIQGAPAGSHGLHIHETGDCSSADFKSAGGHFNPAGVPHGGPEDMERHSGDLGNIEIGEDGSGSLTLTSDIITLAEGQPTSIGGLAVVLHEGTDDLVSQPTGAAGGRIGCGIIERAEG